MRWGGRVGSAVGAFAWLFVPTLSAAASFDCNVRGLSVSEIAICRDPQLSRADEQMARRVDGFARRLNYGQYLGLRFWQSSQLRARERCAADVACLSTAYRTQMRFLDRLQQCLETSLQRRACLRSTLFGSDARKEQQGAPRWHHSSRGARRQLTFSSIASTYSQLMRLSNQASRYFWRALR